jgi:hypothetical protein
MITLNQLKEQWRTDSRLAVDDLVNESIRTPNLHSKYIDFYIDARRLLTKISTELAKLRAIKERYWRGELNAFELEELGWNQWQYSKITRAELDKQASGDADLILLQERVDTVQLFIYATESILQQIKQRDYAISNAVKLIIFNNGSQ